MWLLPHFDLINFPPTCGRKRSCSTSSTARPGIDHFLTHKSIEQDHFPFFPKYLLSTAMPRLKAINKLRTKGKWSKEALICYLNRYCQDIIPAISYNYKAIINIKSGFYPLSDQVRLDWSLDSWNLTRVRQTTISPRHCLATTTVSNTRPSQTMQQLQWCAAKFGGIWNFRKSTKHSFMSGRASGKMKCLIRKLLMIFQWGTVS